MSKEKQLEVAQIIKDKYNCRTVIDTEKEPYVLFRAIDVGKIIGLHLDCPEYVCVDFGFIKLHWHIDIVNEQISHNERVNNPRYIDILYEEIFKAIKQICQNKRK